MSTHTHPWSQLVPVLVLASAGLLAAHFSFDGDTFQNGRYLGPSTRMYVTAWAAPACALTALVLLPFLRRGERRPGRLAMAAVCAVPVLLVQLAALYWVYEPDPSGGQDCSGLTLMHDRGPAQH